MEQDTYWQELSCERKVWFPHELGGPGARPRYTEERESTFLDEGPDDEQEVPPLEHTPQSPWASDFKGFQEPAPQKGLEVERWLAESPVGLPPEEEDKLTRSPFEIISPPASPPEMARQRVLLAPGQESPIPDPKLLPPMRDEPTTRSWLADIPPWVPKDRPLPPANQHSLRAKNGRRTSQRRRHGTGAQVLTPHWAPSPQNVNHSSPSGTIAWKIPWTEEQVELFFCHYRYA